MTDSTKQNAPDERATKRGDAQFASAPSEMSFLDHLEDLRGALLRSIVAVLIASIFCFMFAGDLFLLLTSPLMEAFDGKKLIGTGPAEAFIVKLKVSLLAGVVLASPYSFYQAWNFISPGLLEGEKNFAVPFVLASSFFFFSGIIFCYFVIFPFAFNFFYSEFSSISIEPTIKIGEYLTFAIKLILVFGVVFELPVMTFLLARLGILTHQWLINQGRYSILIIFVVAALLTPPDLATQILLALPLMLIYGICIGVAWFVEEKIIKKTKTVG